MFDTLFREMEVTRPGPSSAFAGGVGRSQPQSRDGKGPAESHEGVHSLLADLLEKGQAVGAIDPTLDRHMAASLIISIIDGSKTLTLRDPELDAKEATQALQKMIVRYLAPPSDSRKL